MTTTVVTTAPLLPCTVPPASPVASLAGVRGPEQGQQRGTVSCHPSVCVRGSRVKEASRPPEFLRLLCSQAAPPRIRRLPAGPTQEAFPTSGDSPHRGKERKGPLPTKEASGYARSLDPSLRRRGRRRPDPSFPARFYSTQPGRAAIPRDSIRPGRGWGADARSGARECFAPPFAQCWAVGTSRALPRQSPQPRLAGDSRCVSRCQSGSRTNGPTRSNPARAGE
ncbi:hypothetical protein DR999_PMT17705 [Platysternon megacephalum]|uniref:Uncharacterized protein n=1 Tax=Platysternon megacephalum TaxID=55544 RepID=A0A4D9DUW8_9SAUR|nr:hypothetical protein DR999_PMT17705 [Platysternon megacephalum]